MASPKPHHPYRLSPSQEFKDGMAVLRMCGYVSRLVYVEMIAHMEDKWPERGWLEAGEQLLKWYYDHGLPLREKGDGIKFKEVIK